MKQGEITPMFFGFHIQKEDDHYIVILQNTIFEKPRKLYVTLSGLKLMKERLEMVIENEKKEREGGER